MFCFLQFLSFSQDPSGSIEPTPMLGLLLSFPLISVPWIWTLEHAGIPRPNSASIKASWGWAFELQVQRSNCFSMLPHSSPLVFFVCPGTKISVVNFKWYFEWFFFSMNTSMRNIGLDFSCIIVGAFNLPRTRRSFGSSRNLPHLSWGMNVCVGG